MKKSIIIISIIFSFSFYVYSSTIKVGQLFANELSLERTQLVNEKKNRVAIHYHTRHIPEEHLNLDIPMGKGVKENGLCDVLTEPYVRAMKDYGIDVIETRLVWWELEKVKGIYDYSRLERDMDLIERNGFKIGVFPWFQYPPGWENKLVRAKCLEHESECSIPSLWDKNLLVEYDKLYKDLSVKFGDRIKFLYLCIYGDYGEVTFPMGENRHYKFSSPHIHSGFWCGDPLARKSFKEYLIHKYNTISELNKSWKTGFSSFEADLMPLSPFEKNNLFQRMDFMDWYTGSLMTFTDNVCKIARKYFPKTELGLPIGMPNENLGAGQIKSIAVKIAAKYGIVARWTGLAYLGEFALSNVLDRRVSSAARFYGCKFGFEAALKLYKDNALNAIYEILTNSTYILHNDPGNILRAEGIYEKYKNLLKNLPVKCDISVYYPVEAEMCNYADKDSVYHEFQELRGYCDYEITDSYMIKDGFLETTKELVLPDYCLIPLKTAEIIREWVKRGGKVWYQKGKEPKIMENSQLFNVGEGILGWDHFGKKDGCYYTDHGNKVSKYDPKNQTITIKNK